MDELIRKQDAIDALGERPMVWTDNDDYSLGQRNQYDLDKLAIETVPSAQPERKTGRWIKPQRHGILSYGEAYAECDQCHEVSYIPWKDRFCRHCGCKMEAEHGGR